MNADVEVLQRDARIVVEGVHPRRLEINLDYVVVNAVTRALHVKADRAELELVFQIAEAGRVSGILAGEQAVIPVDAPSKSAGPVFAGNVYFDCLTSVSIITCWRVKRWLR